jgi:hypothetical protein
VGDLDTSNKKKIIIKPNLLSQTLLFQNDLKILDSETPDATKGDMVDHCTSLKEPSRTSPTSGIKFPTANSGSDTDILLSGSPFKKLSSSLMMGHETPDATKGDVVDHCTSFEEPPSTCSSTLGIKFPAANDGSNTDIITCGSSLKRLSSSPMMGHETPTAPKGDDQQEMLTAVADIQIPILDIGPSLSKTSAAVDESACKLSVPQVFVDLCSSCDEHDDTISEDESIVATKDAHANLCSTLDEHHSLLPPATLAATSAPEDDEDDDFDVDVDCADGNQTISSIFPDKYEVGFNEMTLTIGRGVSDVPPSKIRLKTGVECICFWTKKASKSVVFLQALKTKDADNLTILYTKGNEIKSWLKKIGNLFNFL